MSNSRPASDFQPIVNIEASVDRPGPYVLVVHYYQPYEIGFDVHTEVLAGLQPSAGKTGA